MKKHAIIVEIVTGKNGAPMIQFAVCIDVVKLASRLIGEGFSIYQGIIEYKEQMYDYVLAFSGTEMLTEVVSLLSFFIDDYMIDIEASAKIDLMKCRTDLSKGVIVQEDIFNKGKSQ